MTKSNQGRWYIEPQTKVLALFDFIRLVMPTFSGEWASPAQHFNHHILQQPVTLAAVTCKEGTQLLNQF